MCLLVSLLNCTSSIRNTLTAFDYDPYLFTNPFYHDTAVCSRHAGGCGIRNFLLSGPLLRLRSVFVSVEMFTCVVLCFEACQIYVAVGIDQPSVVKGGGMPGI